MIYLDRNPLVCDYLRRKGAGWHHPAAVAAIGQFEFGECVAGIVYSNCDKNNGWASWACDSARFPSRFLYYCFAYPFRQLGLRRLTFTIAASNIQSVKVVEHLGAQKEATLPDGCDSGDLLIYGLYPGNSKIWQRLEKRYG